jgi:predicted metal-binding protein
MGKKDKIRAAAIGPGEIGTREAAWQDLIVLCRKCGGKLKGGFGDDGRDDLRDALRDELRAVGRRRDFRIIETGCLGICPKGGVVAMRGSDAGRILIVPQGQAAGRVLETLGVKPNRLP